MLHIALATTHKLSTYTVRVRTSINRLFTKLQADYKIWGFLNQILINYVIL